MLILPIEAPLQIDQFQCFEALLMYYTYAKAHVYVYNGNFVVVHVKRHTVSSD